MDTLITIFARKLAAGRNDQFEAAQELLEAATMLECAEHQRQFCDECDGEGEPEACEKCFPSFDDARVKRRCAIVKATGIGIDKIVEE